MNLNASLPTIITIIIVGLVGIGLYGLLVARNLIRVVVCLQVATKGALLALVLAGKLSGKVPLSQSLTLTVIVADTIVAVVALALSVQARRLFGSLDLDQFSHLRR